MITSTLVVRGMACDHCVSSRRSEVEHYRRSPKSDST